MGANQKMCTEYLDLPYIKTDAESCPASAHKVPKKYFSVAKSNEQTIQQVGVLAANPKYERHHFGDEEALEYIRKNCGEDAANAYECLSPAAYRADLFRFCALYSEGGVYMDSDMLPLVPLDALYDPCAVATVGHDWPQGRPQKQMKILAGQKVHPSLNAWSTRLSRMFATDTTLIIRWLLQVQWPFKNATKHILILVCVQGTCSWPLKLLARPTTRPISIRTKFTALPALFTTRALT